MPRIVGSGVANMDRPAALGTLPLDDILEVLAQVNAPIGQELAGWRVMTNLRNSSKPILGIITALETGIRPG